MHRLADPEHGTDAELLAAIADGDEAAFSVLYRRHLPVVVAFGLRATGDHEAAADLAAETFAALLLSAHRYRDEGPMLPWLLGIARNKLRTSRRRGRIEARARQRLGFEPVALEDADLERVDALASQGAAALLDALPEHEREAIRARVLEERSYDEIASELKCSEMVVRKRVSRGLARIRGEMQGGAA